MSQAKYKRVLIKVSGEALSGDKGTGFDHDYIDKVVNQMLTLMDDVEKENQQVYLYIHL